MFDMVEYLKHLANRPVTALMCGAGWTGLWRFIDLIVTSKCQHGLSVK